MKFPRVAVGTLVLSLVVGSCAGGGSVAVDTTTTAVPSPSSTSAPEALSTAPGDADSDAQTTVPSIPTSGSLSPLAELVESVGDIRFDPEEASTTAIAPVSVAIDGIGVNMAPVRDVGVEPNGDMEIPAADEIGWYRWSPTPGAEGSSVLAAHIAFNGVDGVFRRLDDVKIGAFVTIGYDDGSERTFRITEKEQYRKDQLPFDRIFAKDGSPVVALITCGGSFNSALRSYDDNVVAYAVPV